MNKDLTTVLHNVHIELGAKMISFAGYSMPVKYPLGILNEHIHTRKKAGLFDISHMGQAILTTTKRGSNIAELFEELVPSLLLNLKEGDIRYSLLMMDNGCILDDIMITRISNDKNGFERLFLVVNASRKNIDFAYIEKKLKNKIILEVKNRALLALQGPKAVEVFVRFIPELAIQPFMKMVFINYKGIDLIISRCGYTGEDGFEISIDNNRVIDFYRELLLHTEVESIGLGARDSLRLEVGFCLYGNDIDSTTTPVEANLLWMIGKDRYKKGNFPGAYIIKKQILEGVSRKRVGILVQGRLLARAHTKIYSKIGHKIGKITSGGFGPTFGASIAMGYIDIEFTKINTEINLIIHGKLCPAVVAVMPFVSQNYYRVSSIKD